jgi:hypothetical protein
MSIIPWEKTVPQDGSRPPLDGIRRLSVPASTRNAGPPGYYTPVAMSLDTAVGEPSSVDVVVSAVLVVTRTGQRAVAQ